MAAYVLQTPARWMLSLPCGSLVRTGRKCLVLMDMFGITFVSRRTCRLDDSLQGVLSSKEMLARRCHSEIDRQVVEAIVTHGGSVSRFELMSLLGDVADSDIDTAIVRLKDENLIKVSTSNEAYPLITVRENELQKLKNVA